MPWLSVHVSVSHWSVSTSPVSQISASLSGLSQRYVAAIRLALPQPWPSLKAQASASNPQGSFTPMTMSP